MIIFRSFLFVHCTNIINKPHLPPDTHLVLIKLCPRSQKYLPTPNFKECHNLIQEILAIVQTLLSVKQMLAYPELPASVGVDGTLPVPVAVLFGIPSLYKINKSNKLTYNENEQVIFRGRKSMGAMGAITLMLKNPWDGGQGPPVFTLPYTANIKL